MFHLDLMAVVIDVSFNWVLWLSSWMRQYLFKSLFHSTDLLFVECVKRLEWEHNNSYYKI
jgi:hypothetical protein